MMENWTIDNKRGYGLPAYFKSEEDFQQNFRSMLRLVHIIEGSGIIKLNNEITVFSAPALFCLNEQDETLLQQSLNLKAQAMYFQPILINDTLKLDIIRSENADLSQSEYRDYFLIIPFIERSDNVSPYIEIGPIVSMRVSQLFKSMKEELTFMETEFWPCRCRSFLLETLFLIQNMITDARNKEGIDLPVPSEDISDIILYLHTNYHKKITIEELTDIFHINRTTLSEKFKKSIGFSIIEYLVKYRIKMAVIMLRETMLPVAQILDRVGFNDSVHFARMFKKHMGVTPSGYREKYNTLNNSE